MKQIITSAQKDAIRVVTAGNREIAAVYLYGSYAEGTANRLSDIDIAVLLREPPGRPASDVRLDLTVELGKLFSDVEVDVQIITYETGLPFLEEVLRDRILIAVNDEEYRADFESGAFRRILDFQPVIHEYFAAMQDRLKSGTYAS